MLKKYEELWHKVLFELESTFNEETYTEVFANITGVYKFHNGYIYVVVPREFVKNRINKVYIHRIHEILAKYTDEVVKFKFITAEEIIEESSISSPDRDLEHRYRTGNLNATYTFDNYVVGKSNMFAFRMAMKVADQPGAVANPLYIFGDVGLGKTHLMQAIGNYILDNDINQRVLYVKADSFIEDFANLLRRERMDDFNEKYRDIDVLLVDDIQILAGATKSQMEFFKLFDILYQNNKQIVITSDKPASELKNIMTRLTSRFEVGLTVDIQVPDLEHRVQILKRKLTAEASDISEIDSEVLEYIASYFVTNIRELEGALKRVLFYCITNNIDITIDSAAEALEPLMKTRRVSNQLNENNYDKIQSVVSDFYSITLQDLIGKKRHIKYTIPRHIAMYMIKNKYNLPYKKIGVLFGDRDHSTVLAACEKIENELKTNHDLKIAIETINKKIERN